MMPTEKNSGLVKKAVANEPKVSRMPSGQIKIEHMPSKGTSPKLPPKQRSVQQKKNEKGTVS